MNHFFSGIIKLSVASILIATLVACGGAEERKEKYLEKGKIYLEEKNYDKARIEFKNVLQIDPKYAEAYYFMGQLLEKQKGFRKAISNYKKAIELNPNHINAKAKLATIYVIAGTDDYIEKAKKLLNEVKEVDPSHPDALFVSGTVEYKAGNVDKAIIQMEKVLENNVHLVGGIAMLSNIYASKGRDEEAIKLLKKGIADNPDDIYIRINLSKILIKTKDLTGAEEQLKEAIILEPKSYSLQVALSRFYTSSNQLTKAEALIRKGIDQEPDDAKRYLLLAQLFASKFSIMKAEAELKMMIDNKPELYELKYALVKLYKTVDSRDKAKAVLSEIIDDNTYDVNGINARNELAQMLLEEGDLAGAKVYVDEVLKEHPNENDSLLMFSKLALNEMDSTTAINGLRTVVKNNPKNSEASLLLAQAYELNKESVLAENELKRSIEANPVNDEAHINYARYLASKGRVEEAEVVVDRALAYFKDSYGLMELKLKIVASQNKDSEVVMLLDMMELVDETKAGVNITRGQYYLSKKDTKKALEQFEKAYSKSRDKYKILELIVKMHLLNKNPEEALSRLKLLYADKVQSGIAHHLSAKVYLSQKKLSEARDQFKLASKAAAQWTRPYLSLAGTYIAENNLQQAENIYQEALLSVMDKAPVYMQLASLYERQKAYEKAMSVYQQVLDIKTDNMIAKNNYASLLLDHGGDDGIAKALKLLEGFEKIQQPAFRDTLAWGFARSADYDKAVELLKPLVEKTPGVAVFRYHLGYALYYMGDKAAAKSHLSIAVSSNQQFVGKEQAKALLKLM